MSLNCKRFLLTWTATRVRPGLIICQEMVQRQGGQIWVESDGVPGQGTAVNFTTPADQTAR
jgi:signal transduction histidine kinase